MKVIKTNEPLNKFLKDRIKEKGGSTRKAKEGSYLVFHLTLKEFENLSRSEQT